MADPIQPQHVFAMNVFAAALSEQFSGCTFILLIAPPEGPAGGRVNYISNSSDRRDSIALMKEWIARAEGQPAVTGHG
jgi:hypothetical protein